MSDLSASGLLGPAQIRRLAAELEVRPTKKLGQNFVHDSGTVRKIAGLAGLEAGDGVIEVGPGLGSLTLALLEAGARVTAVEIDPRLAARLPRTVREFSQEWAERLSVVNQDAMKLGPDTARDPQALVANLPYNVSVPVLLHVLATFPTIERIVVMVQKEVAERLSAAPGSRVYGAPSVKLAWYGDSKLAGVVGRKVFWPEPNVDSALVAVDVLSPTRGREELRDATFALVDAAFGQRRKMLRSSLKTTIGDEARVRLVLESAGVDPTCRPEDLGIDEFVALGRAMLSLSDVELTGEGTNEP
ncbi:16S rRNA (adenine(1518)-N(6)/adenine(1519)-N(6))-dimethyltransferase RsmA [Actinomycetaceae bacterium MB13-C1-2]|nr:16S rRNA (adenine(1518)-N(6)/adenine(1519)-N(6))-dimethyltransferase RsmA [Actinomycetaceae bacterium MB13-C1-2]